MKSIVEKISQYLEFKGIPVSVAEREIGMTNGSLSKPFSNGTNIKTDTLEKFLKKYTEISAEWLLSDQGEMLKDVSVKSYVKPENEVPELQLIPIDAMAGYGEGGIEVMNFEGETFKVPTFRGAEFLISVKGTSMYPKYSSGDIVACKKIPLNDLFFQWNKVYVLDTAQGAIIKRIKKGKDDNHVLLVSDNVNYDPFELHLSVINAVSIVMGVIRLE